MFYLSKFTPDLATKEFSDLFEIDLFIILQKSKEKIPTLPDNFISDAKHLFYTQNLFVTNLY